MHDGASDDLASQQGKRPVAGSRYFATRLGSGGSSGGTGTGGISDGLPEPTKIAQSPIRAGNSRASRARPEVQAHRSPDAFGVQRFAEGTPTSESSEGGSTRPPTGESTETETSSLRWLACQQDVPTPASRGGAVGGAVTTAGAGAARSTHSTASVTHCPAGTASSASSASHPTRLPPPDVLARRDITQSTAIIDLPPSGYRLPGRSGSSPPTSPASSSKSPGASGTAFICGGSDVLGDARRLQPPPVLCAAAVRPGARGGQQAPPPLPALPTGLLEGVSAGAAQPAVGHPSRGIATLRAPPGAVDVGTASAAAAGSLPVAAATTSNAGRSAGQAADSSIADRPDAPPSTGACRQFSKRRPLSSSPPIAPRSGFQKY